MMMLEVGGQAEAESRLRPTEPVLKMSTPARICLSPSKRSNGI
jgi:hypothetical protein